MTSTGVLSTFALMGSKTDIDSETASAARLFMEKVVSRYDLAGAILFGRRARKSHRPDSDADVAVLLHGSPGKFVATKLAMADLAGFVTVSTLFGILVLYLAKSAPGVDLVPGFSFWVWDWFRREWL